MNRIAASAATLALTAATLGFATPAHAGTDKIGICHATGAGKYIEQTIAKDATANGHAGHQDAADIIPAYSWVDNGTRYYFDGQNTHLADLLGKGCKADATPGPVAPNAPTYTPATCLDPSAPHGRVSIPENLGDGIAATTPPVLSGDGKTFTVTYTLRAADDDHTYTWPANQTGIYTFTVTPITADPLWVVDSRTGAGQCEMPETGAGGISNTALALGGGALGLGLMFVAAASWNNRRRTT